jgi:hypothetical protein
MKKVRNLLLGAIALLGAVGFANAQTTTMDERDPLAPKIGVKGGINLANLYVDDVADENLKVGLNVGLFAKIPLTEFFAIQPEVLYSSKGSRLKYDNVFAGEGEYRFNLNYIEVPFLAVFNLGKHFNIHAGPYASFLTSSNVKDMNDDGTIEGVQDLDVEDFNRFDYGLVGGLGVEFGNFMVGGRYNYGLNEVGKSGSLSGELTRDAKNSVASFYIGFGF